MRAQRCSGPGRLTLDQVEVPAPGPNQVLVKVRACGVCRTDLHLLDGDLPDPKSPVVPGHEIVGEVVARGAAVDAFEVGSRVGIPWLGWTCDACEYCEDGRENLCDQAKFTGYTLDGGYAEYAVADARFCFALPEGFGDVEVAPLLCAGLIGYRTLRLAGFGVGDSARSGARIGIYGFGAAAHIVAQVARYQGLEVFAFTREGDREAQDFARELGCAWAGSSEEPPPRALDAALLFAPVGALVPAALRATKKGGVVVSGGIHMSDIPSFPYRILWEERAIKSVANLTRRDAVEFLALAPKAGVRTETVSFSLEDAPEALERLAKGKLKGAAVLVP